MKFDCGICELSSDNKEFDLIISTQENFHLGRYCNFQCLLKDVQTLSANYPHAEKEKSSVVMEKDILTFFSGKDDTLFEYLLPVNIIDNPTSVNLLNEVFHNCQDVKLQCQILCYWISCVEPSGNWPYVSTFEEVKLPKVFNNGAKIDCDDGEKIIVSEGYDFSNKRILLVKIKDQIHNIPLDEVNFNIFQQTAAL